MTTVLHVEGMTCQNCVRHAREAIERLPDVSHVSVDLDRAEAVVRWESGRISEETLLQALQTAGYPGRVLKDPSRGAPEAGSGWKFNIILGGAVTVPLMVAEWGFGLGTQVWFGWASFLLVLPVQLLCGARFYRGAWQQLRIGQSNMDTLVALGSSTAFLFSANGLLFPAAGHHAYFMEASAIITLISVGHWLEARASRHAAQAVRQLLSLAPVTARRWNPGETEEEVPVASLLVGDRVILRPGDRIPADGQVVAGSSTVDESMLTGESIPVEKNRGDSLYAGTVNTNGRLVCEVRTMGEETALAHIITVVERAQGSRAQIQRLGDRVSSVFVPLVIVVAGLTVLFWGIVAGQWEKGIVSAVSVVIVACPCAMGLATPAAIMAGTNAGAKRGILIRDGAALEKSGTITTVLFDKTGTLTLGKPQVQEPPLYLSDQRRVLSLVQAMAAPSRHPLSQALAGYADTKPAPIEHWREESGRGALAEAGRQTVRLGSLGWLEQNGVKIPPALPEDAGTSVGVASGPDLLGIFHLQDQIGPDAEIVLNDLRRFGLDPYLVSGDRPAVAKRIGGLLGFVPDHVFAGVLPDGKVDVIKSLQAQGRQVAFIGDGINDAPALAQADLGIAVSRASDIAKESADIILLKANLQAVPEALQLSRRTLRTIRQNLFWAFLYNTVAIPIAACGLASPVLCAAAMGLSDLFVVGNSLRLLSTPLSAVIKPRETGSERGPNVKG